MPAGDGAVNCVVVGGLVMGEPIVFIIGETTLIKPGLGAMIGWDGELTGCCG